MKIFALAFVLLMGVVCVCVYVFQGGSYEHYTYSEMLEAQEVFDLKLSHHTQMLEQLQEHLQGDLRLQELYLSRDRQALLRYATPIYEKKCQPFQIKHWYIHNLDRTNFVRMHSPERFGDRIDRVTLAQAQVGGTSTGIEMGPLGYLVLRSVRPWTIEGKLAGYMEVGYDINQMAGELKEIVGSEVLFVADKKVLNPATFEAENQRTGRRLDWNRLDQVVILSASLTPDQMAAGDWTFLNNVSLAAPTPQRVTLGKTLYLEASIPINDIAGRPVGYMVVLHDITGASTASLYLIMILLAGCLLVGIGLRFFISRYLQRMERTIVEAHNDLSQTVAEKIYAENELTQAKQMLESNLDFLTVLVDTIPLPVFYKNADGAYQGCNKAFEVFLGLPRDQIIGKTVYDIAPPELAQKYDQMDRKLMTEGGVQVYEAPVRYADGSPHEVIFNKVTYGPDPRKPSGMIGAMADITEQKKAENELRHNEARLKSLLSVLQYPCKSTQDFLDYALNEAIKLTGSKIGYIYFYHEDSREFVLNTWSKEVMNECRVAKPQNRYELDKTGVWGEAVRQRKPIILNDYQVDHPHKKGCPQGHVALSKFMTIPVFSENRIVAVVGVANKDTDYNDMDVLQLTLLMDAVWKVVQQRQAEESLRQSKVELEQVNHQLEAATERACQMAQDANQANQAKSYFLANMSHEIRTPMNVILGFVDLLAEEKLTAEQLDMLQTVKGAGNTLLSLINDILDLSKIEAGKLTIENIDCSLTEILGEIDSQFRPLAQQKGLEFKVNYLSPVPPTIRTDPTRLYQCLVNLIGNALKFTKQGCVHVNVSMSISHQDDTTLCLEVKDTGIGISSDKIEAVFSAFTQADSSTTRKYGGTGLGLTITKRLVEYLGGSITVESKFGQGTTFFLFIPAHCALAQLNAENESWQAQPPVPAGPTTPRNLSGHVLVAEDNPANQKLIRKILEKMGITVSMAENGQLAVNAATQQAYDLILMDVQMPVMNGYEATTALRAQKVTTPIVALTANALRDDEQKCLDCGCNDYLSKPVNRDKLRAILEKYLLGCLASEAPAEQHIVPASSPLEMIDVQALRETCDDEEIMADMAEALCQDLPASVENIFSALQQADLAQLQFYAHRVKGGTAIVGAKIVSSLAAQMEDAAKRGQLDEAKLWSAQFQAEIERLLSFLADPTWIEQVKAQSQNMNLHS